MIFRLTTILIILNTALFSFLLLNKSEKHESYDKQKEILSERDIRNIQKININFKAFQDDYNFVKNGNNWDITSPINWSANPYAIQKLISEIQFIEKDIVLNVDNIKASGQSISDYGFDNPLLSINLQTYFDSYSFKITEIKSLANKFYLLTPNEKFIYIIDNKFIDNILECLDSIKNIHPFNIPVFEVRSLVIQKTKPHNLKIRLIKNENHWFFETPIQTEADKNKTDAMVSDISTIRIHDFVSFAENSSLSYGLDTPLYKITLEGYSQKETLLIGDSILSENNLPLYYSKLSNNSAIFLIEADKLQSLDDIQDNLRQNTLTRFDLESLNSIKITHDSKSINLQKLEIGSWIIALKDPQTDNLITRPANALPIQLVIDNIANLKVLNFVSDAPAAEDLERLGLNNPSFTIELKFQNNDSSTLFLGNLTESDRNSIYIKTNDGPSVYEISADILNFIPVDLIHYENFTLIDLPESANINKISIKDLETQKLLVDINNLTNLNPSFIKSLRTFQIDSYLQTNYNETFIEIDNQSLYWKYLLTYHFSLPGDPINTDLSQKLYLAYSKQTNIAYGLLPDKNFVFKLSSEFYKLFEDFIKDSI